MNYNKIREICSKVRIIIGVALIAAAVYTGINWLYLGVVPLIAGIIKFCPICLITKKCDINQEQ